MKSQNCTDRVRYLIGISGQGAYFMSKIFQTTPTVSDWGVSLILHMIVKSWICYQNQSTGDVHCVKRLLLNAIGDLTSRQSIASPFTGMPPLNLPAPSPRRCPIQTPPLLPLSPALHPSQHDHIPMHLPSTPLFFRRPIYLNFIPPGLSPMPQVANLLPPVPPHAGAVALAQADVAA